MTQVRVSIDREHEIRDPGHTRDESDYAQLLESLRLLFETAASRGRDLKLISALLSIIIEFVSETQGDVFVSSRRGRTRSSTSTTDAKNAALARPRLRPEFKARVEAVIESWSDDETAWHLGISLRQVRRRAQHGDVYFFYVNGKRRYPVWQFDGSYGVLKGVGEVVRAIPHEWSFERVHTFITTRHPTLNHVTPAHWLLGSDDPSLVLRAIGELERGQRGAEPDDRNSA